MSENGRRQSWTRVRFGDVVRQVKENVESETSTLTRYVAGEHMRTDNLRIRSWGTVGDGYLGPAFHRRFHAGQVLYGSRRTYLRKVAVPDFDGICANTTFVCEPSDERLLGRLLPFVMQSEPFHAHSVSVSKGSVNPYVNWSDLAPFEFSLPDLAEQCRIAQLLEAGERTLTAYEDAEDALSTASAAFVDDFMAQPEHEASTVELDALVDNERPVAYGILKPGRDVADGVPCIAVKDYPAGELLVGALQRTSAELDEEYARSRVRPGDLLLSIRGTVGRLAVVPDELPHGNVSRDTARIALRPSIDRHFVLAMLRSRRLQREMRAKTVGLAVQGINLRDVRRLAIPMPPSHARSEFLERYEALGEAKDELASAAQRAREMKSHLLAHLLTVPEVQRVH